MHVYLETHLRGMVRISWRGLGAKSGEIIGSGIFINLDAEKMMKLNLFKIFENVRSFGIH
jgi:hypothetical protein